jgi:hypothetical protein
MFLTSSLTSAKDAVFELLFELARLIGTDRLVIVKLLLVRTSMCEAVAGGGINVGHCEAAPGEDVVNINVLIQFLVRTSL